MSETIGRIGHDGTIELADERSVKLDKVSPMTPHAAAFLGRELISCAIALSGTSPPPVGTSVADAHLPIISWITGPHPNTGVPTMVLSIPSGIELTFQLTMQGAKELGAGLMALAQGLAPPGGSRGVVH